MIRYMANRNDGHPYDDHGLKGKNFSVDPCWLALRIGFHLIPSTMQLLRGQLSNNERFAPIGSKLPSRVSDKSFEDSQNQITSL